MDKSKPVADSSFSEKANTYVTFLITCLIAAAYVYYSGINAIWPDTLFFADRARHLLGEGTLAATQNYAATYPPLYSLLMLPAFALGDLALGHWIVIGLQAALLASVFFPIRWMLLRKTEISNFKANILSLLLTVSSVALPYASLLTSEALFITLFIWFSFFYDGWIDRLDKKNALASGLLLGLLLLTENIGWIVYAAVVLNPIQFPSSWKRALARYPRSLTKEGILDNAQASLRISRMTTNSYILLIPIFVYSLWYLYSTFALKQPIEFPHFDLNNPLARFNFIKNGLLYISYAGLPLAGLVTIIAAFSKPKETWGDAFSRFAILCILGAVMYMAMTTPVIVEKKLDYITNRMVEPFLVLPFIIFMRLSEQSRKEIAANSLLIFFCLMIFGLPYGLLTDFFTGISYWAQSLGNANLGIIRNVIYLILICLPIALLWGQPKWFFWTYVGVAALINLANLAQDRVHWSQNEDSNFDFVQVKAFEENETLRGAQDIFTNYHCNTKENNDIAYLFRCFDMGKMLYFMPKLIKPMETADIRNLKLEGDNYALFASSEDDTLIGETVGRIGLARMGKVKASDIEQLAKTPILAIHKIDGLQRYVNLPVNTGLERVTLLAETTTLHTSSSDAGCAEMHITLAGDSEEKNVEFLLNDKPIKKMTFKRILAGSVPDEFILPLNFLAGENKIGLRYGEKQADTYTPPNPSLFMFGRPVFKPCSVMRRT